MSVSIPTSVEEKALKLLGDGISQDVVASALGVSPSAISQLMSQEAFKDAVQSIRYQKLSVHTERDAKADSLEDKLLKKLDATVPMLFDPIKIALVYRTVNAAKRRGQTAPDSIQQTAPVHSIMLPAVIIQNFTTNIHNQIVAAGDRELLTIQSGKMNSLLSESKNEGVTDVQPTEQRAIKGS